MTGELALGTEERSEAGRELGGLALAFESFTSATERLEREYAALGRRVTELATDLEEKNVLLAASLERERRLEAEALRQSRLAAMGEMAAMVAHEVRNPLGAMELFTGLLLQDLREQPESQRLARQVAAGIADLNHLVTNLLEFTRTRSAEAAHVSRVDCSAVVEDALRYTSDLLAASGVRVVRRFAAASLVAHGDASLLRPALLNLIRNAVQAMAEGGTLTVVVERTPGGVTIRVADTGPGIPADARDEIFRPFFTTRVKGTGLGLTVVRELVMALGGTVEVASGADGGATFSVCLPASD